jgi:hypothetical protein
MIDPALIPVSALLRTFRREAAQLRSGCYHQLTPSPTVTTDNTLGWNTLRVMPVIIPNRVTLSTLGLEVTAAGAAGAVLRIGIYADNGSNFPGALIADAGTIDGTVVGVSEKTGLAVKLKPGLYWAGAVVQGGTSGTQPTVRTLSNITALRTMLTNGTLPAVGAIASQGFSYGGLTGALPATWTATVSPTGTCARVFAKVA